jgi:branched-chain amino acid transport system ATP-binding protein
MNNQEYRGTALRLERVSKRFGGVVAVEDVSLAIHAGERHVLIGPNGAGKTTLFNCVTGTLSPSAGQIRFFGDDVTWLPERDHAARGMGRTFQISNVFTELTVAENLMLAVVGRDRRKWTMHKQFGALQEVADKVRGALAKVRLDHRQQHPREQGPLDAEQHIRLVLAAVESAPQGGRDAFALGGEAGIVAGGDVVGAEDIDDYVEMAFDLVYVIGDIRQAVGGFACR